AGVVALPDGFLAVLADGVYLRGARYRRAGKTWRRSWLTGEHARQTLGLQVTPDARTLLYAHSAADTPARWYRARLSGEKVESPAGLVDLLSDHFAGRLRARTEVVRWKGGLDEEVEGILYYPHGYQAGRRYPLVVMIHGGPASADLDSWEES